MAGGLNSKFTFYFMETTHEPFHLDKLVGCSKMSWTYLEVLFGLLFPLLKLSDMAMVRNFEIYVVTDAEAHCVEFCNFV
jgi:hypothetical protein